MWGLNDYGSPNDQQAVYDRFASMGPNDFNGGYTWTEEAMSIALKEFNANSTADRSKMIIILTDGEPYPFNQGHEPCLYIYIYILCSIFLLHNFKFYH